MIVDCHCHLVDWDVPSESNWNDMAKSVSIISKRPLEQVMSWFRGQWDITGDLLVQDMDEAGIDKSIVLCMDFGLAAGFTESKPIEEVNKQYAEAQDRHPDRIIAFMGVDPRRPGAIRLLETAVKEWGMKGVKLMPAAGWYPDDKICYPFYQKVQELDVPILIHTGPEVVPFHTHFCRPTHVDEVALAFPDLKIIMAHASHCWWEEAAWIASYQPNVYVDISNWQPKLSRRARPVEEFYSRLRILLNIIGTPKVLFGSDWPNFRLVKSLNNVVYVNAIKNPPEAVKEAGIEFTKEEVDEILGGNAAKILKLE